MNITIMIKARFMREGLLPVGTEIYSANAIRVTVTGLVRAPHLFHFFSGCAARALERLFMSIIKANSKPFFLCLVSGGWHNSKHGAKHCSASASLGLLAPAALR